MSKPNQYRAIFERNVPAVMRDGTTLYADIWRPDADGVFPVLLTRTPYDKSQPRLYQGAGVDPARSVGEGYVVIYQDVRGRFTSEGDWSFECECDDGYDSVEWAASLPFSDGNVGMFGISYLGFTQWMAATRQPPHLKAIFPQQMGTGIRDFVFPGNAFALGRALMWAGMQAAGELVRRAGTGQDMTQALEQLITLMNNLPEAYKQLPLAEGHPIISDLSPIFDAWLAESENPAGWSGSSYEDLLHKIDIPVFQLGSWHDLYCGSSPVLYEKMCQSGASERSRSAQKLIMGPWVHGQMTSDVIGDLYMGSSATAASIDLPGLHLRWFDYWLKNKDTGIMDEPPVRLYVMGENVWRDEQEWPLARTQWTPYYLHSDGQANSRRGDGRLSIVAPERVEPADHFLYDPRNPVPTAGGPTLLPGGGVGANAGPKKQQLVESRPDVLVYSTAPLVEDVEVTGPIAATIYASTTAPDTDWTVRLVDVHADGCAYGITDGIVRARYRNGMDRSELLQPNRIYKYKIDLHATSYLFKKGHRIRVQVSSSNFPDFSRNPNTGSDLTRDTELVTALQTVLHDQENPSHICLPLIPR